MNSMRRGAPVPVAPVFSTPEILPKVAEGLIVVPLTDPTLELGILYSGWFKRLNAAARKLRARRSVNRKRFWRDVSISYAPGPLATKRPRLPQVPLAGAENAAGLNQLLVV